MGISFINSKVLILLFPVFAFVIWIYRRHNKIDTMRDRIILITRMLLLLLIILSLAGAELIRYSNKTSLVFVVDQSISTADEAEKKDAFIRNSLEYKTDRFESGIVTFGKDALVEHSLDSNVEFTNIQTSPQPDFSNIEAGLKLGFGLMTPTYGGRAVLVTDGDENMGDALSYAKVLARHGVVVDAFYLSASKSEDMQISSVELPGTVYEGEIYNIKIVVDSNITAENIPLKLYADRELIGEQFVNIKKGQNIFLFEDSTDRTGIIGYEATIDIDDANLDNNKMAGFTYVEGKPIIGVVEGREGAGAEIAKVLESGEIDYNLIDVAAFPKSLDELRRYSGLILANVSLEDLKEPSQVLIDDFVGNLGRGLIVVGGDNSYALGDYKDSTLEEILPVGMDISSKANIPSLGLMLVIDRSGSMMDGTGGVTRLDLAKEAAVQSVQTLRPVDTVGVVAFDTMTTWIVEPVLAEDKEEIAKQIATLQAGGGTDMYPGLVEAYEALEKVDAKLKHIIALTDGQSAPAPYANILEKLGDLGITLSTVALGDGADKVFLEDLAERGGGRYYFADEFSNIPKIFAKETHMAAQSYVQNRAFVPTIGSLSPLTSNIDSVPTLDGYLTTTAKSRAEVAIVSDEDDPILASWQYGLGKVVSWTSDFEGIWSQELLGTDEGARLWVNSISYILPSIESENFDIDTRRQGDKGEVLIRPKDGVEIIDGEAIVISPSGAREEIELEVLRPGEYRGIFDIDTQGVYSISILEKRDEVLTKAGETALAVSYSPEYDIRDRQGIGLLEKIVEQTGGRLIDEPKEVFRSEGKRMRQKESLAPYLLMLIIFLFIFDIAIRRIDIKGRRGKRQERKKGGKTDNIEPKTEEKQFTSQLLKAREDRKKF